MGFRLLVFGLTCVVVACAGPSTPQLTVGGPDGGSVPPSTDAAVSAPTWTEPESVAPGFTRDALGPVEPGVVTAVEGVLPGAELEVGAPGLAIVITACRLAAPAHWVVEGEAALPGGEPVTATVGITWSQSDVASSEYLSVTFARSGPFALAYDRLAGQAARPYDGGAWQQSELAYTRCGLDDGTSAGSSVEVERFERLPGWQAPPDTVQGYAVGTTQTGGGDLLGRLAGDVWLGVAYPFEVLWLPADPSVYGELGVTNEPACAAVSYENGDGTEIVHLDGPCHGSPLSLGPVEEAAGWEWVDRSTHGAVARRALTDGQLEVRGADRSTVAAAIAQLHPYRNLVRSRRSGHETAEEAATGALAALIEDADPPPELSERGRAPTGDGEVIVYSGVTRRRCDGCADRPEWYAVVTRPAADGWTAAVVGGGEWDGCLALSYGGSSDQGYDTVAVAGDPAWAIEVWNGNGWAVVPTVDGVWVVLADHSSPNHPPTIRAVDATGAPQPCAVTPAAPG